MANGNPQIRQAIREATERVAEYGYRDSRTSDRDLTLASMGYMVDRLTWRRTFVAAAVLSSGVLGGLVSQALRYAF